MCEVQGMCYWSIRPESHVRPKSIRHDFHNIVNLTQI